MARKSATLRYEVLSKIGEGTLFVVYRVRDHLLNQTVALKVIHPEIVRHTRLVQAIRRSEEIATRLPHTNAARVLSIGEEDGTVFVVTEYVPGETLEAKCAKQSPMPYLEAVRIALQVADVLHYAHQNGIVHGNLHPRNVIVTPKGLVKVTDFALAEVYASPLLPLSDNGTRVLPYLSPERLKGQEVAPTDDLYSLGVMLYRMLTGKLPETNEAGQIVPPRALNSTIPPALERIVLKLLADEAQRYQSAGPLIRDLRQVESGLDEPSPDEVTITVSSRSVLPRQSPPRRRTRWEEEESGSRLHAILWTLIAILSMLIAVMVGVFLFYLHQGPPEVRVPDIEGKTLALARQMLQERGLTPLEERVFSDKVPLDVVIACEPEPGRKIKQGRVVKVVISNGAELVRVPDVTGLALNVAKDLLMKQGFKIGEVTQQYHEVAAPGEVISQSVRADEAVPKGTEVALFVSKGPKPEPETNIPEGEQPPVNDRALTEGAVNIRLTVPQGASQQEVKIVVRDALGEHTAYQQYHAPGDVVEQEINIVVASHQKAIIRVFVAGHLVKEQSVAPSELSPAR
ncbi:MAG: PASTA domain-containing protein [Abditibacteriales bacterium]|nr:PASTA domain-containing protein [Abditibacteriales bacterium]MDW8367917.1 PASTA domain-containing protein [Abditibacteriales bacterium]